MNKNTKTFSIIVVAIAAALIALISVLTWVIPFKNNQTGAFIATFVCAIVLIVIEACLTLLLTKKENANKKILGLPIVYTGAVAVVVQLIWTALFLIVNNYTPVKEWLVVIVEVVIYIITIIHIALGFLLKERTIEIQTIDHLKAKVEIVSIRNSNADLKRPLQTLLETIKATDPVSTEALHYVEARLESQINELSVAVETNKSTEEALDIINKIDATIKERAVLAKASK